MIATDEDALICDLAETYHIYDYRQLPADRVAAFSVGLREDSRIKMVMSGQKIPLEPILLSGIVDRLGMLVWQNSRDGQKGINRPASLVEKFTTEPKEREEVAFHSGEDFEQARNELLERIGGE